MIRLIRNDGLEFLLNIDLIKSIESGVDTIITLNSGEKIRVKNSEKDIMQKIRTHRIGKMEENQS